MVANCRVTQGKFDQAIITQGKYKVTCYIVKHSQYNYLAPNNPHCPKWTPGTLLFLLQIQNTLGLYPGSKKTYCNEEKIRGGCAPAGKG